MLDSMPLNLMIEVLQMLDLQDLLNLRLTSKELGQRLRGPIFQALTRKKCGLPKELPLGWLNFCCDDEFALQRIEDMARVMRPALRPTPEIEKGDRVGFVKQMFAHPMESCCSANKGNKSKSLIPSRSYFP